MTDLEKQIGRLFSAELQFRLASATRLAVTMGKQPLDVPIEWSHGHTKVQYEDVALRKDQAEFAAWNLHRSATFLMAVAMKDAIKFAVPDLKNSADSNVKSAYQISRLIRNSFAHSPFDPIWSIDPDCRDSVFEVEGIISLDTTDLQGKPFDWKHYGGPLALYMLCRFVRFIILKDDRVRRPSINATGHPSPPRVLGHGASICCAGRGRPAARHTPPAHNGWTPREARLPRTARPRFALPGAQRKKPRKVVPLPEEIYYQQGDLIFMKLREDHESQ